MGDCADHTYLREGVFHFQRLKRATNSLQIGQYIDMLTHKVALLLNFNMLNVNFIHFNLRTRLGGKQETRDTRGKFGLHCLKRDSLVYFIF